MLESYAVVSMCRAADNSGRAVPLRDAHQTSTQGAWRPRDEVRATSHRPCRFAAPICADSLGALDGDPCRLRARTSCQSAFRWVGCHAVCAPTHLIGGSIPWRIKRRQGHALRGRRAIVKEGEILLLRPLVAAPDGLKTENIFRDLKILINPAAEGPATTTPTTVLKIFIYYRRDHPQRAHEAPGRPKHRPL